VLLIKFFFFLSGKAFDIREFHLVVLKNGAMPLTTLETVVDSWIDQAKYTKENTAGIVILFIV